MSNRTDDLAAQARERAAAEQRRGGGSVGGNSDLAERPDALRREQERKAAEREQARTGAGGETRQPTESTTVITGTDAERTPSPGQAPVETAPADKPAQK